VRTLRGATTGLDLDLRSYGDNVYVERVMRVDLNTPLTNDQATNWRFSMAVTRDRWTDRVQTGHMTSGTAARYMRVFEAFCRYAVASSVTDPCGATAGLCHRFAAAPTRGNHSPTGSTAGVRLAAIRDAFDGLVEAGLISENPTRSLRIDRLPSAALPCPLTQAEAQRLLAAGRLFSTDTLRPACAALALAGATHREIARAVAADVDPTTSRLRLGSGNGSERSIDLEGAATAALAARVNALRREWRRRKQPWAAESVPLAMHRAVSAYRVDSVAPTVSMNLSRALKRAGITRAGVRPRSCREYAANAAYARTGRVEDVAQQLGIVSLDAAYRLLDEDWQRQWGPVDQQPWRGR